jgi:hypothetical protein
MFQHTHVFIACFKQGNGVIPSQMKFEFQVSNLGSFASQLFTLILYHA